ncbi:MAG: hypothetical protein U0165_11220 [Polyangiaceae bacterium]
MKPLPFSISSTRVGAARVVPSFLFALAGLAAGVGVLSISSTALAFDDSSIDSDGDGVPDATDACPSIQGMPNNTSLLHPRRAPACFVGTSSSGGAQAIPAVSWLPAADGSTLENVPGSWWDKHHCSPAMAFPVVDARAGGGANRRGVVIVGTSDTDSAGQSQVAASIKSGDGRWPSSVRAMCLVSIDFDGNAPTAVTSTSPGLADFYVRWNPSLNTTHTDYAPADGMGLLIAPEETVGSRGPEEQRQRALFSRGAVYGKSFASSLFCGASSGGGNHVCEPAGAHGPLKSGGLSANQACESSWTTSCSNVLPQAAAMPSGFTVIPSLMDAALIADRDRAYAAMYPSEPNTTEKATRRYHLAASIDGLPASLQFDDRVMSERAGQARYRSFPLSSGGRVFAPDDEHSSWNVRPAAITRTGQHVGPLETPLNGNAPYHTIGRRPVGDASYGPVNNQHRVLVSQSFEAAGLAAQKVQRQVESEWPGAMVPMATSEQSEAFGHRATHNLDTLDCHASTAMQIFDNAEGGFDLASVYQLPYPVRGTTTPVSERSKAWCASQTRAWANDASNPARSLEKATTQCTAFDYQRDDVTTQILIDQVGTVLSGDMLAALSLVESVGCSAPIGLEQALETTAECMCEVLSLGFAPCVCDPGFSLREFLNEAVPGCWLPKIMPSVWDAMSPGEFRWSSSATSGVSQVALTGLVGPTDRSANSYLATKAPFVGHAHQGVDWRWGYSDIRGIDPWSWPIARRDGNFQSIRGALELHVARGLWTANPHDYGSFELHDQTAWDMMDMGTEAMTSAWPSDDALISEYGIDRSPLKSANPSKPIWGTWADHYGRGMFSPHTASTYSAKMQKGSQGATVDFGVQNWVSFPHRLAMLGTPVIACDDPVRRTEIHPPQIITMDLASVRDSSTGARGLVYGAFGWVNTESPGTIEFDLTPPPRPSASAHLVTLGADSKMDQSPTCVGNTIGFPIAPADVSLSGCGYTIDASGPQHQAVPTLTCEALPVSNPNHLHCTYRDTSTVKNEDTEHYGNAAMTPYYGRSRFDLRVFVGWKE